MQSLTTRDLRRLQCNRPNAMAFGARGSRFRGFLGFVLLAAFIGNSNASLGDHLPDFKECVKVLYTYGYYMALLTRTRSVKLRTVKMAIP